ncbi:MAG: RNA polymerase sigma factor [bacterium]
MGTFESWVEDHWVRLRAVARVVCADMDGAEDVLQDALIELHSRWEKVSTGDNPFGYTVRIIVSKAANRRRSSWNRRVILVSDARDLNGMGRSESESLVNRLVVTDALRTLNPHQRAAVALHYFSDASVSEISALLDRPVGTVTSDLTRARASLRESLGDAGGEGDE